MSSFHDPKKLLYDILQAAQQIEEFSKDLDKKAFLNNNMILSACERKFEIIGEAMNRLRKRFPEMISKIPDADKIIGFRNIIIHGYDIVSPNIIWSSIQKDIPELIKSIKAILD